MKADVLYPVKVILVSVLLFALFFCIGLQIQGITPSRAYILKLDADGVADIPDAVWESLREPVIILPQMDLPTNVRADGLTLYTRGITCSPFISRTFVVSMIQIPLELLTPGSKTYPKIEIVQFKKPGEPVPSLAPIYLGDRITEAHSVFLRNLLNYGLPTAFGLGALVMGLSAFFIYLYREDKSRYAFFFDARFNTALTQL